MKAELEAKGMRIDEFDLLIGATAVFNKAYSGDSNRKLVIRYSF